MQLNTKQVQALQDLLIQLEDQNQNISIGYVPVFIEQNGKTILCLAKKKLDAKEKIKTLAQKRGFSAEDSMIFSTKPLVKFLNTSFGYILFIDEELKQSIIT